MRNILRLVFVVLLFSKCKPESDSKQCGFSIIEKNLTTTIKLTDSKCFSLNSDFDYPRHSYFLLIGSDAELSKFIKKLGLYPFSDSLVEFNSHKLTEYEKEKLWNVEAYNDTAEDSLFRSKYLINKRADFAAYFSSDEPNKVSVNSDDVWNGKIVASLKKDTCLLFVEELKSPKYRK